MRISTLEFEGFGPYRDRQFIDFDQLGESGLYLINGPTGAGKSTVIDAICFGLYGKLASDDADPGRARSDFCGSSDATRVVLVFESAAGRFKVERSPEYFKAKKRGEGLTKSHAECKIHRLGPGDAEVTIAHHIAEANFEIAQRVGLTRDQFVQTVVLPQGKFANFLNAETREREEILKSIFNTGLYEQVASILKERAKAVSEKSRDLGQEVAYIVRQLGDSTTASDDDIAEAVQLSVDSLDESLLETLEVWESPVSDRLRIAQEQSAAATTAFEVADAARTRAREEAAARQEVADAESRATAASQAVEVTQSNLEPYAQTLASLDIDARADVGLTAWEECAERIAAQSEVLGELRLLEDEINQWPALEKKRLEAIESREAECQQHQERQDALPALIKEQEAIEARKPTATEWQELADFRAASKDRKEARTNLIRAEEAVGKLKQAAQHARGAADATSNELSIASQSYRSGIAAELASNLEEHEPCSVCGSLEHPDPAVPAPEATTYEMVEALREKDREAHSTLTALTGDLQAAEESLRGLRESITTTVEEEAAEEHRIDTFAEELDSREEAAKAAGVKAGDLRQELASLADQVFKVRTDIETKKQAYDSDSRQIKEKSSKVFKGRQGFDSVMARHDSLTSLAQTIKEVIAALREDESANKALKKCQEKLAAMPDGEGFADVQAAEEAWDAANESRNQANAELVTARGAHEEFSKQRARVASLCEERAALVGDNQGLKRLSEIFDAGRGSDYGLHIYVLRTLFDKVMALANQRFESLLDGRYRLVTADDSSGDKRKTHGLGVAVQDALTGKVRSAKSLSGGETFCASLALALGLSDAVRMNAGGIRIDSLFIDEGFGSLDSSQLDEVMNMLNQLSTNGRRVGLISHVDSMKETITERIEIHAARRDHPTKLSVSWME